MNAMLTDLINLFTANGMQLPDAKMLAITVAIRDGVAHGLSVADAVDAVLGRGTYQQAAARITAG